MPRINKKYTPEFKIEVIETKQKENLSLNEVAKRFDIYVMKKGIKYPAGNRVGSWERIYLEEGKNGFFIERRGKKSLGRPKKLNPTIEEDLIAKCQRLEMENEYLKKLSALVIARERKEKKSRK